MRQLVGLLTAIFLFACALALTADSVIRKHESRMCKQSLNLIGRDVINYIHYDPEDDETIIDEAAFFKSIRSLYSGNPGDIAGCIFLYDDAICVIKADYNTGNNAKIKKAALTDPTDKNKINTVNNMLKYILYDDLYNCSDNNSYEKSYNNSYNCSDNNSYKNSYNASYNTSDNALNSNSGEDISCVEINFAESGSGDYLDNELYNSIEGKNLFIIGVVNRRVFVSGFSIDI